MDESRLSKKYFARRSNIKNDVKHKPTKEAESILQKECEEHLKSLGIFYFHIPEWVYEIKRIAHIFLGWPDLFIIKKLEGRTFNSLLCVELKIKNKKPRQGQINWAKYVIVHVIRSIEDFKELIEEFIE